MNSNPLKLLSLTLLISSVECLGPDGAPWGRQSHGRRESSMSPRYGDMSLQNDFYGMPSYGMGGAMNGGMNSGMNNGMGGGYGREEYGMPSFGMAGGMGGMNGMSEYPRGNFGGRGSMPMGSMRSYMPEQDSRMNSAMGSRRPNGSSMQNGYGRSMQGGYGRSMPGGDGRSMPGGDGRSMQGGYGRSMQGGYGRSMQGGYGRSQSMTSRGYGRDDYYNGGQGYHHAMGGPRDFQDEMRYGGMPQDRMGGGYGREGFGGSSRGRYNGPVGEQGFSGSDYRTQQAGRANNGYNQGSSQSSWN